jgi:GNAT superfamily N-acetyltransferase
MTTIRRRIAMSVQNACQKRDRSDVASPVSGADISAFTDDDAAAVRRLFADYAASLSVDLAFQSFDDELAGLPGRYAPPRGALLVARVDGEAVGCVGVRALGAETCELKRLFVVPAHRGDGTGLRLLEGAVSEARRLGYRRLRLDTIPGMERAQAMYERFGFRDIDAYTENPIAGTRFLELDL